MDQQDIAQQDPEAIRQQIDETRSSITEKLEALEDQVVGGVQNARDTVEETLQTARDTVEETIETVKSSMRDTMRSVKRTFDVKHQVESHPWPMMGVSFLAGVAGAALYDRLRSQPREEHYTADRSREFRARYAAPSPEPAAPNGPGWKDRFREEIDKAQGVAVGYLMALARDWAKQNFPDLGPQIDDFMHGATEKLGGAPIERSVLHDSYDEANRREEAGPFSRH